VHGIQWLQQHELVIDPRCVNTITELHQYQWMKDKDGNSIRKPVDRNNHSIDALRYAYSGESSESEVDIAGWGWNA
jgi:phage terminase large subunit